MFWILYLSVVMIECMRSYVDFFCKLCKWYKYVDKVKQCHYFTAIHDVKPLNLDQKTKDIIPR